VASLYPRRGSHRALALGVTRRDGSFGGIMIFPLSWRTIMPSAPSSPPKPFRAWNKGKFIGPKSPFTPRYVWSIRARLQLDGKIRDLALFNLPIDSKLGAAISSPSKSTMSLLMVTRVRERSYASARPASRSASRSQNKPGRRSTPIPVPSPNYRATISFPLAGSRHAH
jgi:hypothetical protein